jgi:hypothetical protein
MPGQEHGFVKVDLLHCHYQRNPGLQYLRQKAFKEGQGAGCPVK